MGQYRLSVKRFWSLIMVAVATFCLVVPVGVASAATKNETGMSEPRTWRTVRGIVTNDTGVTLRLHEKEVSYGTWNKNSEPPSELKSGETANFVAGYDSTYYGVSFLVGYNYGNDHVFEVWAICDAHDPNRSGVERSDSDKWKVVRLGHNGAETNSYVVEWHITRK
ncbi:hypothetical protein AOZ06_04205 [Kibdelosporangium phytohabitans]|uniref:Uncharacterized protein n=2 Tax=Kibdelosporangium phytohabitans TaxID=860235 RepID=A0A0N9HVU4_9PSEU|nr:hypothetical protein AOZ06_04205 [Kibdelosporangium phytohabitans]